MDKESLVDNGIKIIEFIQKNKDEIQKTYGRSQIQEPRTRERAAAWELFIRGENPRPEGDRMAGVDQQDPTERRDDDGRPNTLARDGEIGESGPNYISWSSGGDDIQLGPMVQDFEIDDNGIKLPNSRGSKSAPRCRSVDKSRASDWERSPASNIDHLSNLSGGGKDLGNYIKNVGVMVYPPTGAGVDRNSLTKPVSGVRQSRLSKLTWTKESPLDQPETVPETLNDAYVIKEATSKKEVTPEDGISILNPNAASFTPRSTPAPKSVEKEPNQRQPAGGHPEDKGTPNRSENPTTKSTAIKNSKVITKAMVHTSPNEINQSARSMNIEFEPKSNPSTLTLETVQPSNQQTNNTPASHPSGKTTRELPKGAQPQSGTSRAANIKDPTTAPNKTSIQTKPARNASGGDGTNPQMASPPPPPVVTNPPLKKRVPKLSEPNTRDHLSHPTDEKRDHGGPAVKSKTQAHRGLNADNTQNCTDQPTPSSNKAQPPKTPKPENPQAEPKPKKHVSFPNLDLTIEEEGGTAVDIMVNETREGVIDVHLIKEDNKILNMDQDNPCSNQITSQQETGVTKRGIGENSSCIGTKEDSRQLSGAIQSAQKSRLSQRQENASAESARPGVTSVPSDDPESEEVKTYRASDAIIEQLNNDEAQDYYSFLDLMENTDDDDLICEETKFSLLNTARLISLNSRIEKIEEQIKKIPAMEKKLSDIEKLLLKTNTALSTIEGHITSMMIMVPGKTVNEGEIQINEQLKPVIGRKDGVYDKMILPRVDKKISLVTDRTPLCDDFKEDPYVLNEKLILDPINPSVTNASAFIPSYDNISPAVLRSLIRSNVEDRETRVELIELVNQARNDSELNEILALVNDIIDSNQSGV
ncbi:phosphoprotein [Ghana virus]|uniref:Phosphoprotein n=1 Tax=Ghana virus TaxID=2847089 RepID=I0E089_9MONO|nr:phosphoprotein [Ghana virus]AFH96007.1 phosphoprotein [Ghana virus]